MIELIYKILWTIGLMASNTTMITVDNIGDLPHGFYPYDGKVIMHTTYKQDHCVGIGISQENPDGGQSFYCIDQQTYSYPKTEYRWIWEKRLSNIPNQPSIETIEIKDPKGVIGLHYDMPPPKQRLIVTTDADVIPTPPIKKTIGGVEK